MDHDIGQILLMALFVLLSAFFSATETAFSSLSRPRLKTMAEDGHRGALLALRLSERYDDLLSTILIGNNIVNIALASIGTIVFVRWIGDAGVSVSTAVITVVVLIFGEISPKSIAKEMPERFAIAAAPVLRGLMTFLKPVNWVFSKWKKLLTRVFSIKNNNAITQDELLTLVDEAEQGGGMNAEESDLLKSAIEFNDRCVTDILTPRVKIDGVPSDSTPEELLDILTASNQSRLPVYEESLDHIIGVLHQRDYFHYLHQGHTDFHEIMQKAVFVPETAKISGTLKLLQETQSQMAVVADEYGGTIGIITTEDILEELVGEIWDEHDQKQELIHQVNADHYIVDGAVPLELLEKRLNMEFDESDAATLGGWFMERAERIPHPGDTLRWKCWKIDVLKTDGRHVQEMKLNRMESAGC
ncbi:MAG: hemolysin family protein [Eubacteriales bacterium]|nr:hemolysin family protein [Eubacteriales bacterium]